MSCSNEIVLTAPLKNLPMTKENKLLLTICKNIFDPGTLPDSERSS